MPYQVKGNALDVFSAFKLAWGVDQQPLSHDNPITRDLHRTFFLGNSQQARYHLDCWGTHGAAEYYLQGNMSGGNLYLLFGPDHKFTQDKPNTYEWYKNYISLSFAFVNDRRELCGLTLIANREDPTLWFMGLIENTHLHPTNRIITLLTSFDTSPFLDKSCVGIEFENVEPVANPLEELINSELVSSLIANAIDPETNEFNLMYGRILLLLRTLNPENQEHPVNDPPPLDEIGQRVILEDNKAIDIAALYNIQLPTAYLMQCLAPNNSLRLAIEKLHFTGDYQRDSNYLRMFLVLYEAGVAESCKTVLADFDLLARVSNLLSSDNRNLIIALISQNYNHQLFKLIVSHSSYYFCFPMLLQYGVDEKKLQELYNQPEKLEALRYIYILEDEAIRELCLVFWVKAQLTMNEYKSIVTELTNNPGLAQTLVNMDKTKKISIQDLKICAFNSVKRQIKIITYEFAEQFKLYELSKHHLRFLSEIDSEAELIAIIKSLKVIQEVTLEDPKRAYTAVLKNDKEGVLARLFLPQFTDISDLSIRQSLIELFLIGLTKGPVSQAIAIAAINEPYELVQEAEDLHERFLCAKQIQDLNFDDDVIHFTALKDERAAKFRHIILRVEEECKKVHEKVAQSWDPNRINIIRQWQNVHEEYRRTLYDIAYEELTSEIGLQSHAIRKSIAKAEAKVIDAVDPQIKSWLYGMLVVIANILITTLTLGIANYIKEKYTGNYWFFNQTESGEQISALDNEVINLLMTP